MLNIEEFRRDLEAVGLGDYIEAMREVCGDQGDCKFPDSYFGNIRPWDYGQIVNFGRFKPTDVVLECGSYHSYFCLYAARLVKSYTCTDSFYWSERDYCRAATHQTPEEWCDYVSRKSVGKVFGEKADIQSLHYPDGSFDKVVSISTIEHVIEDRKGLCELMRVLKPGGSLLLTTEYNPTENQPYSEDGYYRVYDNAQIMSLFDGFRIDVMKPHYAPGPGAFTTLFLKVSH